MKKAVITLIVLSSLIGLGGFIVALNQDSDTIADQLKQTPAVGSVFDSTDTIDEEEPPHPLSLEAFRQYEFNGQALTQGSVLDTTATYTRYYITYQSDGLTISGIMNVPRGAGPFPVLILNHGYIDPDIYTNGRGLKREQDYLARQGYVVIHPDYSNHASSDDDPNVEEGFRLAYAKDVGNAVMAVLNSDLPFFDKENLGMLGHSMGGGLAQQLMVAHPGLVKAYVLFAPVSMDVRDNFNKWTRSRSEVAERIIAEHGNATTSQEFWDSISPINYIDNITEPIMLHHGTADESVPLDWSERSVMALELAGQDITFHVYPGEPHEFAAAWPLVMRRTTEFFDQYLKN